MMDFLVRQWRIRRTRKSIVRLNQQAVGDFRYVLWDAIQSNNSAKNAFIATHDRWSALAL
ncbi:hypothetical protein Rcae01_01391 [Novipirellula caenicola]|uniref:Uncharacterized protein n=1 Tax=Novipirellula caenicola TaxID=1536901 RepID=A0ABP9VMP9_9BACT